MWGLNIYCFSTSACIKCSADFSCVFVLGTYTFNYRTATNYTNNCSSTVLKFTRNQLLYAFSCVSAMYSSEQQGDSCLIWMGPCLVPLCLLFTETKTDTCPPNSVDQRALQTIQLKEEEKYINKEQNCETWHITYNILSILISVTLTGVVHFWLTCVV